MQLYTLHLCMKLKENNLIWDKSGKFFAGTVSVKVAVMKDGHQFVIHVINPKDDPHAPPEPKPEETAPSSGPTPDTEREKAELESSEKEG